MSVPTNAVTYDVEGLTLAWARTYPDLVGRDKPLLGVHLTDDARSPGAGALATLAVTGPRFVDVEGLGDTGTISWKVTAQGGDGGGKRQAGDGALALANALRTLTGRPVLVTSRGVTAKLSAAINVQGPTWGGAPRGLATYLVDSTLVWTVP